MIIWTQLILNVSSSLQLFLLGYLDTFISIAIKNLIICLHYFIIVFFAKSSLFCDLFILGLMDYFNTWFQLIPLSCSYYIFNWSYSTSFPAVLFLHQVHYNSKFSVMERTYLWFLVISYYYSRNFLSSISMWNLVPAYIFSSFIVHWMLFRLLLPVQFTYYSFQLAQLPSCFWWCEQMLV